MGKKKRLLPLRPESIRVGPFVWTVDWSVEGWAAVVDSQALFDPDTAKYYGFTDRSSMTITMNPHAVEQFQREALLHEVMHTCQVSAGLPNSRLFTDSPAVTGEDFITRISPVLMDTLTRNDGLREYLFWKD